MKHYDVDCPGWMIGNSYGPCEECHKIGPCFDIPHGRYQVKDSIHEYRKLLHSMRVQKE